MAIHASGLSKVYEQSKTQVVALDQVTVDFRQGEFTAIMGPSGSGKSTLMHCVPVSTASAAVRHGSATPSWGC